MKTALITGVTGQDGSYLAELLLDKGYIVHGTKRRGSSFNTQRIDHLIDVPDFELHYADMTDPSSVQRVLYATRPEEIYNLAAQSHVAVSFDLPAYTTSSIVTGTTAILEWMRYAGGARARMYQASSSEMFGNEPAPQRTDTPFSPESPYAAAKVCAHNLCELYRKGHGLFIACGILFNHESPRRGETFVTRKITRGLARIKHGLQEKLVLGNLTPRRDWGYAGDYVEAMWRTLQQEEPRTYTIGTGETATVAEFLAECLEMSGVDAARVDTDHQYMRLREVTELRADTGLAEITLGWKAKRRWREVAALMMGHDLRDAEKEARALKA